VAEQFESDWDSIVDTAESIPTRLVTDVIPIVPAYNAAVSAVEWIGEHPEIEDWLRIGGEAVRDFLYGIADTPGKIFKSLFDGDAEEGDIVQQRSLGQVQYWLQNLRADQFDSLMTNGVIDVNKFLADTIESLAKSQFFQHYHGGYSDEAMELMWQEGLANRNGVNGSLIYRMMDVLETGIRAWSISANKAMKQQKTEVEDLKALFLGGDDGWDVKNLSQQAQYVNYALESGMWRDPYSTRPVPLTSAQRQYLLSLQPTLNALTYVFQGFQNMTYDEQARFLIKFEMEAADDNWAGYSDAAREYIASYKKGIIDMLKEHPEAAGVKPTDADRPPIIEYDGTTMDNAYDDVQSGKKPLREYIDMLVHNDMARYWQTEGGADDEKQKGYWNRRDGSFFTVWRSLVHMTPEQRRAFAAAMARDENVTALDRQYYNDYASGAFDVNQQNPWATQWEASFQESNRPLTTNGQRAATQTKTPSLADQKNAENKSALTQAEAETNSIAAS
jgi:hypothetical protein